MNNDNVLVCCCHDFYMNVRAFATFSLAALFSFGTIGYILLDRIRDTRWCG